MNTQKTILLIEDNADDEEMALYALRKQHIADQIIVARDGKEALDYLFARGKYAERDNSILPHLILLDIKLPRVNGIEVLRRIRNSQMTRFVPVVMLTTSDEDQDRRQCYELNANSFIRKPVNFDSFVELIRNVGLYWLEINEAPPVE